MLTLGTKITVDTNELLTAERKLNGFADKFEHKFAKKWSKMFGIGAMVGGVFGLIHAITGKPEEIEKLSKHFGLTTDEVQLLTKAFSEMGLTFDEGMEKAKKGAIDLAQTLGTMRARGDFKIIKREDIDEINRTRAAILKGWDQLKNWAIAGGASISRGQRSTTSLPGPKGAMARGMLSKEENAKLDVISQPLNPVAGGGLLGFLNTVGSGFVPGGLADGTKSMIRANLQMQLRALQSQSRSGSTPSYDLLQPGLTDRQQVGAYSSQRGEIVAKLDRTAEAAEGTKAAIEQIQLLMERIG
jgi:hypothetical protein